MNDIFDNIVTDKLTDAKESLYSILNVKMGQTLDKMKEIIAGKLTKENLDEARNVTSEITSANDRFYGKIKVNGKPQPHLDRSSDNREEVENHIKKHTDRIKSMKLDKVSEDVDESFKVGNTKADKSIAALIQRMMDKAKNNTKEVTLDDLKSRSPRGQGKANEDTSYL